MQIENNKVVTFHYRLTEENGDLIEDSFKGEPMSYLHGHHNILASLEAPLVGKQEGDEVNIVLNATEAYGPRKENATQRVPIKHVATHGRLKPGMMISVQTEQGMKQVTVLKVGKFNVDVDLNHPLAGKTLCFAIKVMDIRDATNEEITHGHAHGLGGHHH